MKRGEALVRAARKLSREVDGMRFGAPVDCIYNPLDYARGPHELYLRRFGDGRKKVVFLGMNPGPFGMAQTGVPFGEIGHVRDWMKIDGKVGKPDCEHPKKPIQGFDCHRSEVSGRRLWGAFRERFGTPERFFRAHFVANYCPLIFMEETGRNLTPDKLKASERAPLYEACDRHLRRVIEILEPEWLVAVGQFAEVRAREALGEDCPRLARILHPSPASPIANRGWAAQATLALEKAGIW